MAEYRLQASGCLTDWYVLEGGTNWASVEGPVEDWSDLVGALLLGEKTSRHKRCAYVQRGDDAYEFWSPRNCSGDDDCVAMTAAEARAFALHARGVLNAAAPPPEGVHPADVYGLYV